MIELVIKKFLDVNLNVPSFFEHKPNMPESYVILEKTGSGGSDYVHSATFAFQSYAPSLQKYLFPRLFLSSVATLYFV